MISVPGKIERVKRAFLSLLAVLNLDYKQDDKVFLRAMYLSIYLNFGV